MSPPARKILIRLAQCAAVAVILLFVYLAMRRELSKATAAELRELKPDGWLVVAAGLCLGAMNTVQMVRYRSLLRAYGARPAWRQMAAIAWVPPLGKYVPGSVWSLMGAIAMLKRYGVNAAVAISVVIMVDAFSEVVGLTIAAPLLLRAPLVEAFPAGRWLAPLAIGAGVVALAPPVFGRMVRLALRVLRREPLGRLPTWGEYVVPVLSAIVQWALAGLALWLMARSVTPIPLASLPAFTMVAAAAMAVGYLAFFTSAGLGPREAIFVLLIPPLLPPDAPAGTVAVVTIAMRLLQVVVEVALAGLGALMMRERATAAPTAG